MDVDALAHAAARLSLGFRCCDDCCEPRFVFLPGDPPEAELSASSKHKFYVVKKGAPGQEGIYSHWDLAQPQVLRIRGALHESCSTADVARRIWADYCHQHHAHTDAHPPAPPAYSPVTPLSSPRAVVTPSSSLCLSVTTTIPSRLRAPPATPTTPTPSKFYRVAGTPRVLIYAERELRALGTTPSLLIGKSLVDVEDDNNITPGGTLHFYRVFGSPRVQHSREAAVVELVETQATGLLVGTLLAAVDH
ncbi:hypothetical protein DFH08DRAFT_956553 [Mycena albidolilacea]|uniref:Ribonuclease H1 N-terminal domain-containing protein n=1 Tax=Mycena albidolilacea TaxID=1033008 RepID=A0AAD7AAI1_9AGAR|nr:hypothetical protein DFH08DRAFT_956553 [Mycena albidolilacea]